MDGNQMLRENQLMNGTILRLMKRRKPYSCKLKINENSWKSHKKRTNPRLNFSLSIEG